MDNNLRNPNIKEAIEDLRVIASHGKDAWEHLKYHEYQTHSQDWKETTKRELSWNEFVAIPETMAKQQRLEICTYIYPDLGGDDRVVWGFFKKHLNHLGLRLNYVFVAIDAKAGTIVHCMRARKKYASQQRDFQKVRN